MTFAGVPILDWVLLLVLCGFGVEAWVTMRAPRKPPGKDAPTDPRIPEDAPREH